MWEFFRSRVNTITTKERLKIHMFLISGNVNQDTHVYKVMGTTQTMVTQVSIPLAGHSFLPSD